MKLVSSLNERGSAESLRYFVQPRNRSGLFVATVGGKFALGDTLCVYEMDEPDALRVPHVLRHRVLGRHLVADESNPGRFVIEGCKVDIRTVFEDGARKEEGFAQVDSGFIQEIAPPPAEQCRMN